MLHLATPLRTLPQLRFFGNKCEFTRQEKRLPSVPVLWTKLSTVYKMFSHVLMATVKTLPV
jgi:hypothetical protein